MSGKTFIVTGVLLTAASLFLNLQYPYKYSLFLVIGIGLVAFGFVKIMVVEAKPKKEYTPASSLPDMRPHPHERAPYHPHNRQHHYHTSKKPQFCARCGNPLTGHDVYCSKCGKKVT